VHRHRYSGRKARILPEYREGLLALVAAQPDLTLVRIPTQTGHQSDLKSDSVPIQSGQCSD